MDVTEYNSIGPLIALIDEIIHANDGLWGIACIKRDYLKPVTNEAFILAVTPALQVAHTVNIFFIANKRIYIAWSGERKAVYKHLRNLVMATLGQAGMAVEASAVISYVDPRARGVDLKATLKAENKELEAVAGGRKAVNKSAAASDEDGFDFDDDGPQPQTAGPVVSLSVTPEQVDRFRDVKNQRPYRKHLEILVVEDQLFSQKLLCDIIRSARTSSEAPVVDAVQGIQDAWKLFLRKAHDILYVDLGLIDGSGHALARAVKELDPMAQVVIVTANNYEEELGVARQNNVDGFIAKPYNKKQILECIDKCMAGRKGSTRGGARGSAGQF